MNELINLHITHEYYIMAKKLVGLNAVQVTYPPSIIYETKINEKTYIYHSVNNYVIVYENNIDNEPLCQLKSPNYIHRILLLEDVFLTCNNNEFNTDLIVCIDENDKKVQGRLPLFKLMDSFLVEDEQKKEKNLSALFYELVLGKDNLDKADKFNVVDGYHIISNVLKNRGICK